MIGPVWTAKNVALLRRLWAAGDTASVIAAKIGHGVTRSAVLGKVHRLGLPMRSGPDVESARLTSRLHMRRKRKATLAQKMGLGQTAHIAPLAAKISDPLPMPPPEPKSASAVKFESLEAHQCRWVWGEGADRGFCGEKTIPGTSWCQAHHARVFRKWDQVPIRRREYPQRQKTFDDLERENA